MRIIKRNAQYRALERALEAITARSLDKTAGQPFGDRVSQWLVALARFSGVYVYAMQAKRRYWAEHRTLYGYGKKG